MDAGVHFNCHFCGADNASPAHQAGTVVECVQCGSNVIVPKSSLRTGSVSGRAGLAIKRQRPAAAANMRRPGSSDVLAVVGVGLGMLPPLGWWLSTVFC